MAQVESRADQRHYAHWTASHLIFLPGTLLSTADRCVPNRRTLLSLCLGEPRHRNSLDPRSPPQNDQHARAGGLSAAAEEEEGYGNADTTWGNKKPIADDDIAPSLLPRNPLFLSRLLNTRSQTLDSFLPSFHLPHQPTLYWPLGNDELVPAVCLMPGEGGRGC